MSYTDHELEAIAAEYDGGITAEQLEGDHFQPGPLAWLLDVVDDWEAFSARAQAEHLNPTDLVRKAVDAYLHAA